jgi:hypothetical protein
MVGESGSFSGGDRRLNRKQSRLSYAVPTSGHRAKGLQILTVALPGARPPALILKEI